MLGRPGNKPGPKVAVLFGFFSLPQKPLCSLALFFCFLPIYRVQKEGDLIFERNSSAHVHLNTLTKELFIQNYSFAGTGTQPNEGKKTVLQEAKQKKK